eukprot:4482140-Heterocapsa_arctica.AAC.1
MTERAAGTEPETSQFIRRLFPNNWLRSISIKELHSFIKGTSAHAAISSAAHVVNYIVYKYAIPISLMSFGSESSWSNAATRLYF